MSSSYIYRAYDKNERRWLYLDALGNDYFINRGKSVITVNISKDAIEKVDKYRAPLGLSRSRYIDYVINEHFSVVENE
jgi:hypothetical protein